MSLSESTEDTCSCINVVSIFGICHGSDPDPWQTRGLTDLRDHRIFISSLWSIQLQVSPCHCMSLQFLFSSKFYIDGQFISNPHMVNQSWPKKVVETMYHLQIFKIKLYIHMINLWLITYDHHLSLCLNRILYSNFQGFLIRWKLEASRGPGQSRAAASKVVDQGPLRALQKEVLAAPGGGGGVGGWFYYPPKKWPLVMTNPLVISDGDWKKQWTSPCFS